MQQVGNAMASVKETAANVGASATSGMSKTQATIQEKVERMTAHDPVEKDMATNRKEEKIREAELSKREAREQNAASKQAASAGGTQSYSTTGGDGHGHGSGHVHGTANKSPGHAGLAGAVEAHCPAEVRPMGHAGHRNAHVSGGLVASQYGGDGPNTAGIHPIHGTIHPDAVIGSQYQTGASPASGAAHRVGHATGTVPTDGATTGAPHN